MGGEGGVRGWVDREISKVVLRGRVERVGGESGFTKRKRILIMCIDGVGDVGILVSGWGSFYLVCCRCACAITAVVLDLALVQAPGDSAVAASNLSVKSFNNATSSSVSS